MRPGLVKRNGNIEIEKFKLHALHANFLYDEKLCKPCIVRIPFNEIVNTIDVARSVCWTRSGRRATRISTGKGNQRSVGKKTIDKNVSSSGQQAKHKNQHGRGDMEKKAKKSKPATKKKHALKDLDENVENSGARKHDDSITSNIKKILQGKKTRKPRNVNSRSVVKAVITKELRVSLIRLSEQQVKEIVGSSNVFKKHTNKKVQSRKSISISTNRTRTPRDKTLPIDIKQQSLNDLCDHVSSKKQNASVTNSKTTLNTSLGSDTSIFESTDISFQSNAGTPRIPLERRLKALRESARIYCSYQQHLSIPLDESLTDSVRGGLRRKPVTSMSDVKVKSTGTPNKNKLNNTKNSQIFDNGSEISYAVSESSTQISIDSKDMKRRGKKGKNVRHDVNKKSVHGKSDGKKAVAENISQLEEPSSQRSNILEITNFDSFEARDFAAYVSDNIVINSSIVQRRGTPSLVESTQLQESICVDDVDVNSDEPLPEVKQRGRGKHLLKDLRVLVIDISKTSNMTLDSFDVTNVSTQPTVKRRGRKPKKSKAATQTVDSNNDEIKNVVKRRGRGKKALKTESTENLETLGDNVETNAYASKDVATKKLDHANVMPLPIVKRGRKNKVAAQAHDNVTDMQDKNASDTTVQRETSLNRRSARISARVQNSPAEQTPNVSEVKLRKEAVKFNTPQPVHASNVAIVKPIPKRRNVKVISYKKLFDESDVSRSSTPTKTDNMPIYSKKIVIPTDHKRNDIYEFDDRAEKRMLKAANQDDISEVWDKDIADDMERIIQAEAKAKRKPGRPRKKPLVAKNVVEHGTTQTLQDGKNVAGELQPNQPGQQKPNVPKHQAPDAIPDCSKAVEENGVGDMLYDMDERYIDLNINNELAEPDNPQLLSDIDDAGSRSVTPVNNELIKVTILQNIILSPPYYDQASSTRNGSVLEESLHGLQPIANSSMLPEASTPWRMNLPRYPLYLHVKNSHLPSYNQELVIDSTHNDTTPIVRNDTTPIVRNDTASIVHNEVGSPQPCSSKLLKQPKIINYLTNIELTNDERFADQENCSLFDAHLLFSPVKSKRSKSPMKKMAESPVKKNKAPLRGILKERNNISEDSFNLDNILNDGQDVVKHIHIADAKPTRMNLRSPKKRPVLLLDQFENAKEKVIVETIPNDLHDLESGNDNFANLVEDGNTSYEKCYLFQELEPDPDDKTKTAKPKKYERKTCRRRARAHFDESTDDDEPAEEVKKRKPRKNTKAAKEAKELEEWASKFNQMCEEVNEHSLEIERVSFDGALNK